MNELLKNKTPFFQEILKKKIKKEDFIEEEYSPSLLPNVKEGSELILKTLKNKKNIFIAGDFDADGVTSTTSLFLGLNNLLKKYLKEDNLKINFKVPTREEGHGLNKKNIDLAKEKNSGLIITCDNGSNDKKMIEYARTLGIEVLVTDHHPIELKKEEINYLIINPLLGYPDRYICGVGVVYKFLKYLESLDWTGKIREENGKKIKMLTMAGTISDMVPLKKENLYFVLNFRRYFEEEYKKDTILGDILKTLDFDKDDGKFFGWKLGPLLNGPGRLGDPNELINLLIYGDLPQIKNRRNERHKKILKFTNLNELKRIFLNKWILYIESNKKEIITQKNKILLITHKDIPSGIKRLLGNEYNNENLDLILCGGENNKGEISISAINNTGKDIISFLKENNLIIGGGGHLKAFGFSYRKEKQNELLEKLSLFLEEKKLEIENKDNIWKINYKEKLKDYPKFKQLVGEISSFIWGQGLEEPLFQSELEFKEGNINLLAGKHLSINLEPKIYGIKAIKWNSINKENILKNKKFLFTLSLNKWNGNEKIQFILK